MTRSHRSITFVIIGHDAKKRYTLWKKNCNIRCKIGLYCLNENVGATLLSNQIKVTIFLDLFKTNLDNEIKQKRSVVTKCYKRAINLCCQGAGKSILMKKSSLILQL
ncbi:hypothetical protein BLOT_009250 [Blomia tropicalis]|nr:hypothetical protein BLOT_009250 [Blomia tropicalis]